MHVLITSIMAETIDYMPYDIISVKPVPVLKEIEGWKTDVTKITTVSEIPAKLADYITFWKKNCRCQ